MRPPASPVSDQRRPAAIAATPLHQVVSSTSRVADERLEDVDADAAHEPEVVGQPPPGLGDVVDGDVLEETRNCV